MRAAKSVFTNRLLLSTALVVPGLIGYGARRAYASGPCLNTGGSTYLCSGAIPFPVAINADNADVSMDTGATVDTTGYYGYGGGAAAITISGDGDLSFTNTAGGAISGKYDGLNISAGNGLMAGSVTINSTQSISGYNTGIRATNNGSGALTINAADVTGGGGKYGPGTGINAYNGYNGTDLSITTTGTVSGKYGISARNSGSGALTINVADVTGGGYGYGYGGGIDASNNYNGTNLSITATGTVAGGRHGIRARNSGSGALTINVADVTGTYGSGIDAYNGYNGTDLSITATGTVTGSTNGYGERRRRGGSGAISARNYGTGALTINVVDVAGTSSEYGGGEGGDGEHLRGGHGGGAGIGINAYNGYNGTDLSITSTGTVSGEKYGIQARNNGSGALTINVNNVNATGGKYGYSTGISAFNSYNGTDLVITASGTVQGSAYGIRADNRNASGALIITANNVTGTNYVGIHGQSGPGGATINVTGDVTGGEVGIALYSTGDTEINISEGAAVSGGNFSIDTAGKSDSNDTINLRGALDGDARFGGGDDLLRIFSTAAFGANTMNIDGGDDNDTLELTGEGTNTLDGSLHSNFEHLEKTGTGTWTLTGDHNFGTSSTFFDGTLDLVGNLISPQVTNQATLAVGGVGAAGMGTVTGNLTQTGAGTFAVDVDGDANTADLLTVTGTADLAGAVLPTVTGTVVDGSKFTILTAAGGTTNSGLSVTDTAGFDFTVEFIGNNVVLTIEEARTVLEALNSLGNKNQNQVASYLDGLKDTGELSDELADLITALLALPDEAALADVLNKLIPSHLAGQIDTTVLNSHTFGNAVMSCGVSSGAYAFIREGQCTWVKVTGRYKHHDATNGTFGFRETAGGIAGGVQIALHDELRFGWAFDYERSEVVVGNLAETEGDRAQAGVIIKNRWGGTTLAAAFTGGFGRLDSTRNISVPGFVGTANSDQRTGFAGVKLRAGHLIEFGGAGGFATWYLKPQVDLNGTYVNIQNFAERGAGALNLVVAGNNETIFSVSPGLEIGGAVHVDGGTVVRPWVRVGATFFDNTSSTISATFQGAPTGVTPFQFTTELDDTFFDVATGMNVLWDSGVELRLNYDGRFSESSEEHSGGVKMGMKF